MKRLIIIAAGNTNEGELAQYPHASQATSVESPGQSWNALTVGAYTEKQQLTDPQLNGYTPIAPSGGLSPFSTTSLIWDKKWAVKPDIVFEGGNAVNYTIVVPGTGPWTFTNPGVIGSTGLTLNANGTITGRCVDGWQGMNCDCYRRSPRTSGPCISGY